MPDRLLIAKSTKPPSDKYGRGKARAPRELLLPMANRHGLIAGATGTGKSVTLRVLAEGFSASGVPVFLADVKGDLAGMAEAGGNDPRVAARAKELGLEAAPEAMPTVFWDLAGAQGHPVRTTISDMGPLLLARLLELNDTQSGVLELAFKIADDHGLLLLDLKDLRALLRHLGDNSGQYTTQYGAIAPASIGAIQRALLALAAQGGESFFGEPMLDLADLMRRDGRGRGLISILAADKLMLRPRLYATFLLWLLAELFETLPEVGDLDAPKLVVFFDEAHLLFADAPAALVDKVEQVVRLIRSKGVGVYFVTQSPLDLPDKVLGQLGNKIQHALRAFTPRDQKAVRAAAETFRASPGLDTAKAILELGVGEALVSLLDANGAPAPVDRALIVPPRSRLGALDPATRQTLIRQSPFAGKYDAAVDRPSAYETLAGDTPEKSSGIVDTLGSIFGSGDAGGGAPQPRPQRRAPTSGGPTAGGLVDAMAKSVVRNIAGQIGREIGRQILRGVLGSMRGR
jgi:DNA helicase HerA-like ATPase